MPDEAIPQRVHLIGIGGAHMSAIARILLSWGHSISGSDMRQTGVTDAIEALGARVVIGPHDAANVFQPRVSPDGRFIAATRIEHRREILRRSLR